MDTDSPLPEATALRCLELVNEWLVDRFGGGLEPALYPPGHEGDFWAVSLEGFQEWAVWIGDARILWPQGVFPEPVYSWCLGLYPSGEGSVLHEERTRFEIDAWTDRRWVVSDRTANVIVKSCGRFFTASAPGTVSENTRLLGEIEEGLRKLRPLSVDGDEDRMRALHALRGWAVDRLERQG